MFKSALDAEFQSTIALWLQERGEILVMFRYPNAGGARDYELHDSVDSIMRRLSVLPSQTSVIAFRHPQLQQRGTVTRDFIATAMDFIPDGVEFLVVETALTTAGSQSWFHNASGSSRSELREELEQSMGRPVMLGRYPPWLQDGPDVISGYVPNQFGQITPGAY
jgi:hypothetical protein